VVFFRPFVLRVLAVLLHVSGVEAQSLASEQIASLEDLVLHARYPEARTAADELLARTLSASERVHVLELFAIVALAERDDAGAIETLAELYRRDPEHALSDPTASPPVRDAFDGARASAGPHVEVALAHRVEGAALAVRFSTGADAVDRVRVSHRERGATEYAVTTVTYRAEPVTRIRLPGGAAPIEYTVEALAPSGAVLASIGSADAPLSLDREDGGTIFESGWFWIAVGSVLAAGAVIGLVIALGGTDPQGSLGGGSLE
jgi:hypothetical protein